MIQYQQKSNGFIFVPLSTWVCLCDSERYVSWWCENLVNDSIMNSGDRDRSFEALNLLLFSASQHAASLSQNGSEGSALAPWQADKASAACQGPGLLNDQRLRSPDAALADPEVCVFVHASVENVHLSMFDFIFSFFLKWPQCISIIQ